MRRVALSLLSQLSNRHQKRCFSSYQNFLGQPARHTHPHLVEEGIPFQEYVQRRKNVFDAMPSNSVLLVPSNPQCLMNNDVHYKFRQHADLFYLSGFQEPESLLIMKKSGECKTAYVLLVQERDAMKEQWEGSRAGVEGTKACFGVDDAFSSTHSSTSNVLKDMLTGADKIFFDHQVNPKWTEMINQALQALERKDKLAPVGRLIGNFRLIKSSSEIQLMQRATSMSVQGFQDVMRKALHTPSEHILSATFDYSTRCLGSEDNAYPSIVAGGSRALTLHYDSNNNLIKDDELVLVDAGAQLHGYASDLTRTFPRNGKFTPAQHDVYQVVLETQKACVQRCLADGNTTMKDINNLANQMLIDGLISLGIVKHTAAECLQKPELYKRFYPHSIGHYLGLEVHDTHVIPRDIPLQSGMVVTIEPGLYIPQQPDVPVHFRGIGIRIEDDVLIADSKSPVVFSRQLQKEIQDIELFMKS
eukprot:TRINITY_DN17005_c0_g1_i1.p1 TRINITY_DN17005_c0_g1~~TRINITY_DN17005_c0_g1_i1.p1  ORF type:complete len:474 (+),score=44.47 TRINITY_DN17005_c0_g1_i1:92-1513(+)